ncbi:39S ribosomal protein L32, mitochondrial isoform X1 [Trichosurus vulpecula]|uniref:39S ribosomal protein L32, mitochondrial isoform X1 n=1 Tax=Trichosurus vulpecula TaxID=9337 RepID=UPI00186AE370|nr:39S ribosomal protein L32, mitochondrial isoform X1 [Trichosurus vulpecula]
MALALACLRVTLPSWPAAATRLLQNCWARVEKAFPSDLSVGFLGPSWGPALAVQGPAVLQPMPDASSGAETPSFLDSVVWMAAPKNRRTIEVNRCRRRNPRKLIKVKNNIDVCPECGHLKQKHVLCGYCYKKVREETAQIRRQIGKQEGGPFKAPTVETVVLYQGEVPLAEDQGKRIIERDRKRPSWFIRD